MITAQLVHVASGLIVACLSANVVRLDNPLNPPANASLWELVDYGTADDYYYFCNVQYGTCLGSLHPLELREGISAEDRTLARDKQLLWHYNASEHLMESVEAPNLILNTIFDNNIQQYSALEFYKKEKKQKFNLNFLPKIMINYRIVHVVTGFVLYCATPNVVRLVSNPSDLPLDATLWKLVDYGSDDDYSYICNKQYGTCLGTLYPVETFAPIVAVDRAFAKDKQLVWHYNVTEQVLESAEDLSMLLNPWYHSNLQPNSGLQFYPRDEHPDGPKFTFTIAAEEA